jgi:hypothetical protein
VIDLVMTGQRRRTRDRKSDHTGTDNKDLHGDRTTRGE